MSKLIKILGLNFKNSFRESIIDNVVSLILFCLIVVFIISKRTNVSGNSLLFLIPLLSSIKLDILNKNINFEILVNYPLRLHDIIQILSYKYLVVNTLLNYFIIVGLRFFIIFNLSEWLVITLLISYSSLILYFLIQLLIRKSLDIDLISILIILIMGIVGENIFLLIFKLSSLSIFLISTLVILVYHFSGLKIIEKLLVNTIGELLEKNR